MIQKWSKFLLKICQFHERAIIPQRLLHIHLEFLIHQTPRALRGLSVALVTDRYMRHNPRHPVVLIFLVVVVWNLIKMQTMKQR